MSDSKPKCIQRTGSYKIRGPLNKFAELTPDERKRGVVCSSAGNHAQGVALAAQIYGIKAVVCMATNATPSKIEATKAYGAEVVLHGNIWDEANEVAKKLVAERGLTYIHPFDDLDLIAGQGTLGLEIMDDFSDVDVVVVPIGGGGLISGVSMAVKMRNPKVKVIGVESSGAPGMQKSVRAGHVVTLDKVNCIIDGLRVKRVGETTSGGRLAVCGRHRNPAGRGDLRERPVDHGPLQGGGRRAPPRRQWRRSVPGSFMRRPGRRSRVC